MTSIKQRKIAAVTTALIQLNDSDYDDDNDIKMSDLYNYAKNKNNK